MIKIRLLKHTITNNTIELMDKHNIHWLGGDIIEGKKNNIYNFISELHNVNLQDVYKYIQKI